jgi:hypothetical protein
VTLSVLELSNARVMKVGQSRAGYSTERKENACVHNYVALGGYILGIILSQPPNCFH